MYVGFGINEAYVFAGTGALLSPAGDTGFQLCALVLEGFCRAAVGPGVALQSSQFWPYFWDQENLQEGQSSWHWSRQADHSDAAGSLMQPLGGGVALVKERQVGSSPGFAVPV